MPVMQKALLSNILVIGVLVAAGSLFVYEPAAFRDFAQEDGFLEWATFWSFVLAGFLYAASALAECRGGNGGTPWFTACLAIFCLLVALEEISWGQRLFGYQPPAYFLEQNYQQEFNLHNIVGTDLRMLAMQIILVGYGVVASALNAAAPVRGLLERLRVIVPPPALIPSFAALATAYAWYPVDLTGEWVEFGLGLAFVAAASFPRQAGTRALLAATSATAALSVATVLLLAAADADPGKVRSVRAEIEALAQDFASPKLHTRCGIHKRLYTFMREYGQPYLVQGEFARLLAPDDPTRAAYLLDPWNSPYWLRHECGGGRQVRFVYSFGPNRRRDSTERELLGDDIGAYIQTRR